MLQLEHIAVFKYNGIRKIMIAGNFCLPVSCLHLEMPV